MLEWACQVTPYTTPTIQDGFHPRGSDDTVRALLEFRGDALVECAGTEGCSGVRDPSCVF